MWVQVPLPAPVGFYLMTTSIDFANYVKEALDTLPQINFKKIFGEYVLYYNEEVVALLCDNQFFLKPTHEVKNLVDNIVLPPSYPSKKLFSN